MASTAATMQCPQPSLLFTHQGGWSLISNRRGTRGTVFKCHGGELGSNPGVSASEAPALGASHLPLCFLHAGLQSASLKPRKCAFRSALAFSPLCFGKRFAKRLADPRPEPRWAQSGLVLQSRVLPPSAFRSASLPCDIHGSGHSWSHEGPPA